MRRERVVAVGVLLVVLGGAACGESTPPPPRETPEERFAKQEAARRNAVVGEAARGPGFGTVPTAPPAGPTGPGAAWFVVENLGVVKLENGRFSPAVPLGRFPNAVAVGADGSVWVVGNEAWRIEAGGPRTVGTREDIGRSLLNGVVVGPNGHVWAWGSNVIAHFDGTKWTVTKGEDLGVKHVFAKGIAIDGAGRAFVTETYRIRLWSEGTWSVLYDGETLPEDQRIGLTAPAVGSDGALIVPTWSGVMRYDGQSLALGPDPADVTGSLAMPDFGPDGTIHEAIRDGLAVYGAADGQVRRRFSLGQQETEAKHVRGVTADARGRSWLWTDNGVIIVDAEGHAVQWRPGSVPELSAEVKDIAVVGAGPELPGVGAVATGTIRGRLLYGEAPAKGARLQLCPNPASMFQRSPCENESFRREATLADDGAFEFPDVPLNNYGVAAHIGGGWHTTMGARCAGMKPGDTCDLGTLSVRADR